jgi:sugar lactone lactonase YvrE
MRFVPAAIAAILLSIVAVYRIASAGTASNVTPRAIFVANDYDVTAYRLGSNGDVPPIALTTDMASPSAIARDSSGRIYVTNSATNTITVYAANANGNVEPVAVIGGSKTKLSNPVGIALSARGKIYVANDAGGAHDSVTVYGPLDSSTGILNEAPVATVEGPLTQLEVPSAIALDSADDVYVANDVRTLPIHGKTFNRGRITIYRAGAAGNVAPIQTIAGDTTGLAFPLGITLDSKGNIYVANEYTANKSGNEKYNSSITTYSAGSAGNVLPLAILGGEKTGLDYPQGIAVDSTGNLYAAGYVSNGGYGVNIYASGSHGDVPPDANISGSNTGLVGNVSVVLDSARNLYVLNTFGGPSELGSITTYPAGSSGNVAPTATITSSYTGIDFANGLAVDPMGKIYVANGEGTITIYPAGSYATQEPIATIAGGSTGLYNLLGIGLDSGGNILALNRSSAITDPYSVTTYPAGSSGDVPPATTLAIDRNGKGTPFGIAVVGGNLYVANEGHANCNRSSCFPGTPDNIAVYPADADGEANPLEVIEGPATNLASPAAVAVDHSGSIYVANDGPPACTHACNQCIPIPNGAGSVTVYAPGSNANSTPIRKISGGKTGLIYPTGVALDSSGNIYVLNSTHYGFVGVCVETVQNSRNIGSGGARSDYIAGVTRGDDPILIFAPGSDGDVAPIATISGPFAGLSRFGPTGIAIGPTGP